MSAEGQSPATRVLVVVAHPDDDTDFVGAVYKLTHVLGGKADLCIVTNGEGGYRYATLAEPIYGLKLTQESVGRKALPAIRKKEARAGGAIAGYMSLWFVYHAYLLIRKQEGLGMGDFKMLAWVGAFWGWAPMVAVLFGGAALGSVVGIPLILMRKGDGQTMLPFGCFLALAVFPVVFFGPATNVKREY